MLCIPLQGAYAVGGTLGDAVDPGVIADELGTRTGRAWVVRLVLLALAACALPRLRRSDATVGPGRGGGGRAGAAGRRSR